LVPYQLTSPGNTKSPHDQISQTYSNSKGVDANECFVNYAESVLRFRAAFKF